MGVSAEDVVGVAEEDDPVGEPKTDGVEEPEQTGAGMKVKQDPYSLEYRWECLMMLEIY